MVQFAKSATILYSDYVLHGVIEHILEPGPVAVQVQHESWPHTQVVIELWSDKKAPQGINTRQREGSLLRLVDTAESSRATIVSGAQPSTSPLPRHVI